MDDRGVGYDYFDLIIVHFLCYIYLKSLFKLLVKITIIICYNNSNDDFMYYSLNFTPLILFTIFFLKKGRKQLINYQVIKSILRGKNLEKYYVYYFKTIYLNHIIYFLYFLYSFICWWFTGRM